MKRETIALHAGYQSEPTTKSAAVPIYQTTSYTFDNTQHGADLFNLDVAGNIYTRIMKATKPQTVQIVRQGEATPYWFKFNPLYKSCRTDDSDT